MSYEVKGRTALAKLNMDTARCDCGYLDTQPEMKEEMASVVLIAWLDTIKDVSGTCRGCGKGFTKRGMFTVGRDDEHLAGYIPIEMLDLDEGAAL